MPDVIILQAADAEAVRGPSAVDPSHVLQPLPLSDGTFYLGTEVLNDPMHDAHKERLAALPTENYDDIKPLIPQPPEAKPA